MKIEINLDFLNYLSLLTKEQLIWCGVGLWYFIAWIVVVFILQIRDPIKTEPDGTIFIRIMCVIFSPAIVFVYIIGYLIILLFGFRRKNNG